MKSSVTPAAFKAATVSPPPATVDQLACLGQPRRLAGQRERAVAEGRDLEGAERAVPQQRLALLQHVRHVRDRLRADVEDHGVARHGQRRHDGVRDAGS